MKELLVYRYEEVINAPIDVVFDYVNDDEKIKCWNTLFVENIYEAPEDKELARPGTKFKTVQKIDKKVMTIESVLIEFMPPYKIVMHSQSKEGLSISKYELSREYHGTRLIVEASIIPSNFLYKIATKLLGWTSKYIYEEQYKRLKTFIEEEIDD